MRKQRVSRLRRSFKSKVRSYTRLGIEQLEDRCFLSANSLTQFGTPVGMNSAFIPSQVTVVVVEPVATGSVVSWVPLAELTATASAPGSSTVTDVLFNGDDNLLQIAQGIGPTADPYSDIPASTSQVQLSIGQASVAFVAPPGSTAPLNVRLSAPELTALGLPSNLGLPEQSSGNASLGSNIGFERLANGGEIAIVNAGTDNPAMSGLVSGASLAMFDAGASPAMAAMVSGANVTLDYGAMSLDASSAPVMYDNLTALTLAPTPDAPALAAPTSDAPTQVPQAQVPQTAAAKAAAPSSAAPTAATNSLGPAAPAAPNKAGLGSPDDSLSAVTQSNQLSAPNATVSSTAAVAIGSTFQNPAASDYGITNTPINPVGATENLQRLVPVPASAPASGRPVESPSPTYPGLINDNVTDDVDGQAIGGADHGAALSADAATRGSAASLATAARSQAALLSHLPLDVRAIDQALENLLGEIDEIGSGLAGWWAVPPLPRWTLVALALACTAGGDQLRRARRRRKSPYEQATEADSLSWMFSSWQGLVPKTKD